jgi:hypothetical protein
MIGTSVKKFRNKPLEVEALFFDGTNADAVIDWLGGALCETATFRRASTHMPAALLITTPEGRCLAEPGDWIVRAQDGAAYPLKSLIFESKFVLAGEG